MLKMWGVFRDGICLSLETRENSENLNPVVVYSDTAFSFKDTKWSCEIMS